MSPFFWRRRSTTLSAGIPWWLMSAFMKRITFPSRFEVESDLGWLEDQACLEELDCLEDLVRLEDQVRLRDLVW